MTADGFRVLVPVKPVADCAPGTTTSPLRPLARDTASRVLYPSTLQMERRVAANDGSPRIVLWFDSR
jgi:hypothetical protein